MCSSADRVQHLALLIQAWTDMPARKAVGMGEGILAGGRHGAVASRSRGPGGRSWHGAETRAGQVQIKGFFHVTPQLWPAD